MAAKFKIEANFGDNRATCEGDTQKEVFEALASASEILQFTNCGHCDGRTRQQVRTTKDGDKYYSVVCIECRHELSFGQSKDNENLFPKSSEGWKAPYQSNQSNQQQDF